MKGLLSLLRLVPVYSAGIRLVIFLGLALLLSACGSGGGNGGGNNGPDNNGGESVSSNADLSGLSLSAGSFDQIFQSEQTSYTGVVRFAVASLDVIPTSDDLDATIQIGGEMVESGAPHQINLAEGKNSIDVKVTAADGVTSRTYGLVITRQTGAQFAQRAYVKASNTESDDLFGRSVSLSGDTLAVGAVIENSNATAVNGDDGDNSAAKAGAVYVFTRDGSDAWTQQAYVKASNTDSSDRFGWSVSLSGDTLAVGAHFEDSNAMGVNGDDSDNSASSSGAVYVFTRDGTGTWIQQAYVKASNTDADDQFGYSVSLSGDTLAVGARLEDSNAMGVNGDDSDNSASSSGAVYVFTRDGTGIWTQEAYVKASNTDSSDLFGSSLALDGKTLVVGASGEASRATGVNGDEANDEADSAGAVYVFTRDGTGTWIQQAYVKASNTGMWDQFGYSVSLSGDTLAAGASVEDSNATGVNGHETGVGASGSGAVYVFTRDVMGTWTQQAYVKASNTGMGDIFGASMALAGDTLAVGAPWEDSTSAGVNGDEANNNASKAGAVYVFTRDDTGGWSQQAYVKASNTGEKDLFGTSVSMDDDTLAVGAPSEASNATGVSIDGTGEGDNSANGAGAVYIRR